MDRTAWWKGARGEWYVVIQLALFALVAFGPRTITGLPEWPSPFAQIGTLLGAVLIGAGFLLAIGGIVRLGVHITPLPYPKESAPLVETGPYGIVRHPIYSGAIIMALGWALLIHGWLTIVYAVVLFLFFDVKSRREEGWLAEKFAGYGEYQKRVRKLIPFVY